MKTLAIDVGGTKIYNTIVDEKGEIIAEIEKYSTPKTLDEVLALFQKIISKHEKKVDMIAFATAGAVNNENSKVISATGNLPTNYREIEFKSLSTKPVFIENDANCAVYAEYKIGAGKNYSNIVLLTLGTGVGGGIIVNNKLLKGKSGAAGEMHFKMRMDNHRKCTCGAYDCFEAYASGTALKKTAEEISGNPDITTYDVIDGLKKNDELMTEIFNTWQDHLLMGIIGLANIFDPDCIILSGSMAEFVNLEYLEKEANYQILTSAFKVLKASAGNYAGMIGASLLALEKFYG